MEIGLLAVIGISLATMFFGYFFGLFEGRGQGYKKRKKEEASDPVLQRAAQAPLPPPSPPVESAPRAIPPAEKSLLTLTLDARQQPCLDMDGQRIDTTRMSPEERRRLIDLMVMMRPWIDAGPVQKPQPTPPPPAARAAPPPAVQAASAAVAGATAAAPPLAGPAAPPEPASAATTMVGQIDAILQTKLTGTPLATRGIRLVESTQGGAMVVIGLNRYAGVGEVPDPEIQAVIRAAIAEWENRYTPG